MKNLFTFLLFIFLLVGKAQISPPGLGEVKNASWYAVGVKQNLNKDKTFESMSYLGLGLNNKKDFYRNDPAIVVINQEFYHQISSNLKLSYALSYRKQKDSKAKAKKIKQESRLYGRAAYTFAIGKIKFTETARQEIRKFVDEDWKNVDNSLQLRSRFKTQASINLDTEKHHKLTTGAEFLFSVSKDNNSSKWKELEYKESRFTMFYTYKLQDTPIALSLGYMTNLLINNHTIHYASVDLIIEDPFKLIK